MSELTYSALMDCEFSTYPYQDEAIDKIRSWVYEDDHKAGILQMATGCISGDAIVTINRGGKGVTRSLRDHFRLQADPRVKPHVVKRVRSFNGKHVECNGFSRIQSSGVKPVVRVRFASGRELVCTPDHKILSSNGWVEAKDSSGKSIVVEASQRKSGDREPKPKKRYRQVNKLYYHPYAGKCVSNRRGKSLRLYRVAYHRLVVESEMNEMPLDKYIECLRNGDIGKSWVYLDPAVTAVHHVNGDHTDNRSGNLAIMSHQEHWSLEGKQSNHLNIGKTLVETDNVFAVENAGWIDTYDIVSVDKTSNFIANGVVVHNCGKTVTVGILIRQLIEEGFISRALFAVHRTELVKQAIDTFELCGLMVGREQGSHHGFALGDPHVVCTTIQSMTKRCKRYQPDDFQLIITDEVHHAGESNKTYSSVYDHFPDSKLVGVTATIDRPDGQSLKRFEEVVYSYSLYDAIHDPAGPFLSPVKFVRCSLGVDLRGCKTTGKNGDFAQGDLGRKIQPAIELLANAISKEIEDRKKIIVFMPDVGSSIAMADALKQLGHAADWVSGDKPDRDSTIQRYKNGLTKILVNCQILTEGFDDKPTDCVVLKPTRSRIAYAQMVGRGTRLCKDKSDCLILDFSHTTDMDLIGPSSLTDCEEVDSKRAEELVEEGVDLWQAVERAKTERKQRQEIKVPVARLDMSYRRVEINPFELAASLGVSRAMLTNANRFGELATPAQKDFLNKSGMADVNNMTKRQASQLIGQIIDRRNSGLCSIKQLNYLISLGMKPEKARGLQFGQAAEAIQKYRSNQAGSQE